MGRAWRSGQIDQAIGAAGLPVLHGYAGAVDRHGNELVVTEVAVADEIAAAADLVKGKLTGIPVAVVRGLHLRDDGSTGRDLLRPGEDDLFWLGTAESIDLGRRQAQLLRRSVRQFSDQPVDHALIEEAVAEALTAPLPITRGRCASSGSPREPHATARCDETTLARRPFPRRQAHRRRRAQGGPRPDTVRRPEVVIPFMVPDGAHHYPDDTRTAAERTMFTVAAGAAVQALLVALAVREVGSCWIGSTIFAADLVREQLELPEDWNPMGAIAIGYPVQQQGPRDPAVADGLLVRR